MVAALTFRTVAEIVSAVDSSQKGNQNGKIDTDEEKSIFEREIQNERLRMQAKLDSNPGMSSSGKLTTFLGSLASGVAGEALLPKLFKNSKLGGAAWYIIGASVGAVVTAAIVKGISNKKYHNEVDNVQKQLETFEKDYNAIKGWVA